MVSKNDHVETIFNIPVMVRDERKRGSSLKIPFKSLFGMFSPNLATEKLSRRNEVPVKKAKSLEKDDDSCTNCFKFAMNWSLCNCGKCECNAAALWEKLQQRSRVTKFLMGLNGSYEATRRHILMLKPIPSVEDVFNMVTQDERHVNIKPMSKSDNVVFHTSVSEHFTPTIADNQSSLTYTGPLENNAFAAMQSGYHGQTGHVIQKYFKLHGYPPGYIPGYKSNQSNYSSPQRPFTQNSQPRAQFNAPRPQNQTHAVANVMTAYPMHQYSYAPTQVMAPVIATAPIVAPAPVAASPTLDLNQMNNDQVQALIQQLQSLYRALIGRLLYLCITRPDITFAVNCLSHFLSCPTDVHMQAAHNILKYLKNNPGQGLFYSASTSLCLNAFSDADWGEFKDSHRSVTGLLVFLEISLIIWKSKKQETVSSSSTESEYCAMAVATKELLWLQQMLTDLHIKIECAVGFVVEMLTQNLQNLDQFMQDSSENESCCSNEVSPNDSPSISEDGDESNANIAGRKAMQKKEDDVLADQLGRMSVSFLTFFYGSSPRPPDDRCALGFTPLEYAMELSRT